MEFQGARSTYAVAAVVVAVGISAVGAGGFGCGSKKSNDESTAQVDDAAAGAREIALPDWNPASVPYDEFVGAAACQSCHQDIYAEWAPSPHGRAMMLPSDETVLGQFASARVELADGIVTTSREGDEFFMEMATAAGADKRRVDLVLASGRQHQAYFTRTDDGAYRMLPLIWASKNDTWIATSLYAPGALGPRERRYWETAELTKMDCMQCHLSQGRSRIRDGRVDNAWGDLSNNCESCHGPGRAHVTARTSGQPGGDLRDLAALGQHEEARVCGNCHGLRRGYELGRDEHGIAQPILTTLTSSNFRVDGTQFAVAYQNGGHMLSPCFLDGGMKCVSCHAPHSSHARDLVGASAEGAETNRQCTSCHRSLTAPKAALEHSRHSSEVTCVNCHMANSWMWDTVERQHETSDHTISIPHPAESLEFGVPNACTTCHGDKDASWALDAVRGWGQTKATAVRPWVAAIALAREDPDKAVPGLVELLDDAGTGDFLRASALDFLARASADAEIVAALAPHAESSDASTRGLALLALRVHDRARSRQWLDAALADQNAYVRLTGLDGPVDPAWYTAEHLDALVEDVLRVMSYPNNGLGKLVRIHKARGETDRVEQLLALASTMAVPMRSTPVSGTGPSE